jgi:hypothetical protein
MASYLGPRAVHVLTDQLVKTVARRMVAPAVRHRRGHARVRSVRGRGRPLMTGMVIVSEETDGGAM